MNTLNQSIAPQGHRPFPSAPDATARSPAPLHLHLDARSRHPRLVVEVETEDDARIKQQSPSAIVGGFLRSLLQKEDLAQRSSFPTVVLAVSVVSAVKLEKKQMRQIEKKMQRLTGFQHLKLENTVDPTLIAGFVIRYGDDDAHVIDLSVKGQLAQIAERLESSDQSQARDFSGVFWEQRKLSLKFWWKSVSFFLFIPSACLYSAKKSNTVRWWQ